MHGFINNALKDFIIEIKDVLLKKVNLNVVVIDWSKGIDLKAIFFKIIIFNKMKVMVCLIIKQQLIHK